MKLYYVANADMLRNKAHTIQIAKTCEAFLLKGVQLELVVPKRSKANVSVKELYNLEVDTPMKFIPIINTYTHGRLGFLLGSLSFVFGYLVYLLSRIFRGEKFTIYSVDMDTFSSMPLVFLPRPVITEAHGKRDKNMITTFFFKHLAGIIAINKYVKKNLVETFTIPEDKVLVEPNGVDVEAFNTGLSITEARDELGLPHDSIITLYVGRFYGWKGMSILIDLASRLPSVKVCVVGGTKEEFTSLVERTDVPENLQFFGLKPFSEVPLWMAAANSLLLLGTNEDNDSKHYTSPMKAFEYMATGRPIVASKTPAIQDIFSDERGVFMYTPDDVQSMAQAIERAHTTNDGEDRELLNLAKEHSWHARIDRITNFIESQKHATT